MLWCWGEGPVDDWHVGWGHSGGGTERVRLGKQKVCHDRMEKEKKRKRKIWKSELIDPTDLRLVIWIHFHLFLQHIHVWLQHMENCESIQTGFSLIFIDVHNGLSSPEMETFSSKANWFSSKFQPYTIVRMHLYEKTFCVLYKLSYCEMTIITD